MRRDGREVRAGCDADARLPAVRNDLAPALSGHLRHAPRLGEAADPPDVRLRDVDEPSVHQVRELVTCGLPLAGCDLHGRFAVQAGVTFQIVDLDGGLEEKEVEFLPITDGAEAGFGVRPGILDVD